MELSSSILLLRVGQEVGAVTDAWDKSEQALPSVKDEEAEHMELWSQVSGFKYSWTVRASDFTNLYFISF